MFIYNCYNYFTKNNYLLLMIVICANLKIFLSCSLHICKHQSHININLMLTSIYLTKNDVNSTICIQVPALLPIPLSVCCWTHVNHQSNKIYNLLPHPIECSIGLVGIHSKCPQQPASAWVLCLPCLGVMCMYLIGISVMSMTILDGYLT
jgi:hypothetical protein